jgi:hypothetical protein
VGNALTLSASASRCAGGTSSCGGRGAHTVTQNTGWPCARRSSAFTLAARSLTLPGHGRLPMYRQRLTALRNVISRTRDISAGPTQVEDDVAKKEVVLCSWCGLEAEPGADVARQPACDQHRRDIAAELRVNAGRAVTPRSPASGAQSDDRG